MPAVSSLSPGLAPGGISAPTGRGRRATAQRLAVAVALAVVAALVAGSSSVLSARPSSAGLPVVKARAADSIANAFGVKVETSGSSGNWGDHTKVLAALKELQVRHIRTEFWNNNQSQYAYLRQIHALGITDLMIMGRPNNLGGTVPQLINAATTQVPGAYFAFEGANEWDRSGRPNWAAEDRAHQSALYTALKANPATRGYPVFGPSIGGDSDYAALGNVSPWLDYGNLHTYPGGMPPSNLLDKRLSLGKVNRGSKPAVSSETGYHNAIHYTGGHRPASEAAAGIYYPRMVLEDMLRGMNYTFGFQLIEPKPDPSATDYITNLGLVRSDWSRKPAFYAMRNLLSLTSDPGPAAGTGSLAYGVSGAPSDLKQMLFQKRDGSFLLFLWRDVSIFNPNTVKPIGVAPANVTVQLGTSARVGVIRPSTSASPSTTVTGTSVPVSLSGEVVALQIG